MIERMALPGNGELIICGRDADEDGGAFEVRRRLEFYKH